MSTPNETVARDADLICIGAAAIAKGCFQDQLSVRQVYRLAEEGTWPFVRIRGRLAMRPVAARAELERREAEATHRAA